MSLPALGDDLSAVQRDLDELEAFGFDLERHPYLGASYRGPAARLCPDQIEWGLNPRHIGRRIAVWNRVTSTNDLAIRAAESRANDGLVVLAEAQTAGRGRQGRSWSAPPASALLMSLLVFPPEPIATPYWLTALGAVAVAELVEHRTGRPAGIKWPNDVRVDGRKVAGVLVERGSGSIIGIGLNVHAAADDFPAELRDTATSLALLAGRPLDRSDLARELVERLDARYGEGLDQGPGPLDRAWRSRLELLGQPVRVITAGETVSGQLLDAGLSLGVVVATSPGAARTIPAPAVRALTAAGPAS